GCASRNKSSHNYSFTDGIGSAGYFLENRRSVQQKLRMVKIVLTSENLVDLSDFIRMPKIGKLNAVGIESKAPGHNDRNKRE
ncbi:hypothetical protein, partial [Escherichia coli]|uniref:hypothetical protein n=1 Tax=Escherichia coli TaxID=562 RepID=UPI003CE4BCF8